MPVEPLDGAQQPERGEFDVPGDRLEQEPSELRGPEQVSDVEQHIVEFVEKPD
jgi:hypothetical protein